MYLHCGYVGVTSFKQLVVFGDDPSQILKNLTIFWLSGTTRQVRQQHDKSTRQFLKDNWVTQLQPSVPGIREIPFFSLPPCANPSSCCRSPRVNPLPLAVPVLRQGWHEVATHTISRSGGKRETTKRGSIITSFCRFCNLCILNKFYFFKNDNHSYSS